jgi:hypothetical protein
MSRTLTPASVDTDDATMQRARAEYRSALDHLRQAKQLLARTNALLNESEELERRLARHAPRRPPTS